MGTHIGGSIKAVQQFSKSMVELNTRFNFGATVLFKSFLFFFCFLFCFFISLLKNTSTALSGIITRHIFQSIIMLKGYIDLSGFSNLEVNISYSWISLCKMKYQSIKNGQIPRVGKIFTAAHISKLLLI